MRRCEAAFDVNDASSHRATFLRSALFPTARFGCRLNLVKVENSIPFVTRCCGTATRSTWQRSWHRRSRIKLLCNCQVAINGSRPSLFAPVGTSMRVSSRHAARELVQLVAVVATRAPLAESTPQSPSPPRRQNDTGRSPSAAKRNGTDLSRSSLRISRFVRAARRRRLLDQPFWKKF